MTVIRYGALPHDATPPATNKIATDGSTTSYSTLTELVDAARPYATQAEAEAGVSTTTGMNPLRTAQEIAALGATLFATAGALAAVRVPAGGTTNQVLAKASATDNDAVWSDVVTAAPITANTMLVDNAAGTAREVKNFDYVRSLVASPFFATKAAAAAYAPTTAPTFLRTAFYDTNQVPGSGASYKNNGTSSGDIVITLSGSGTLVGYSLDEPVVDIGMFGAVGGAYGTAAASLPDDTTAIQAALDYGETMSCKVTAPTRSYKITTGIEIHCNCDLSAAIFEVNAAAVAEAIQVGEKASVSQQVIDVSLPSLNNYAKTASNWTGFETSIGVHLCTLNGCKIRSTQIKGFGEGMVAGGYSNGFAYNSIWVGKIYNNKRSLVLRPGNDTGWCNENSWYDAWIACDSSHAARGAGVHYIVLEECSATNIFVPNKNRFVKPSLEGTAAEYQFYIQGEQNQFIDARAENTDNIIQGRMYSRTANQSSRNTFTGGYKTYSIAWTVVGTCQYNSMVTPDRVAFMGGQTVMSLSSGFSGGISGKHIAGFAASATEDPFFKSQTATDWTYAIYAQGLQGKKSTDAQPRITLNFDTGVLSLSNGTLAPGKGIVGNGTGDFLPTADNTLDLGAASLRFNQMFARVYYVGAGTSFIACGGGSPEAVVTAPRGSIYMRNDGGAGTTLYVKETGTGNTGWAAK